MADERVFIHRVDGDDVVDYVNRDWLEFAAENWDAEAARRVVGRSLWDYVAEESVRELLQTLFQHVRETGSEARVPYRCDSPDTRRFFEMHLVPLDGGGLEVRSRILREEERAPVPLLDPAARRTGELLTICSWCKRVNVPPWMEVEEALEHLELFNREAVPKLTHGICDECLHKALNAVESCHE